MERLHVLTLRRYCDANQLIATEVEDGLLIDASFRQGKKLVDFARKNFIPVEWCKVHSFIRYGK